MKINKWLDVTMTIEPSMMVYKNLEAKKPAITTRANYETHEHYESSIAMDLHTGTHIDMPLHMIKDGATSDTFSLEAVNGKCFVIDLTQIEENHIEKSHLLPYEAQINAGEIIILKTKNCLKAEFDFEFVFLAESGAQYLLERGIKSVGIDALGIERSQPEHPTHKILLGNHIYIIEGLALAEIKAGPYKMLCLPLKIANVEGLPARALLKPM
ncbi:cyclase family protein [Fusibacter sp. 3D3]|uniref:cyclase family protein n=1 Tax=Fusibacter sp. 3D3 TaxID=1048380 RepID=UPI000853F01E|nr:cyclase family protein [Fusibacter sp. 3D3]